MSAGIVGNTGVPQLVDGWIYSFHMPLFFLLAGVFAPKAIYRWGDFLTFVEGKLGTVVYPYLVWSIFTIVLKSRLGSIPTTPRDLSEIPQILYSPVEQYWFLYSLFLIFLVFALAKRFGLSTIAIACLSSAVWLFPFSTHWPILDQALLYAIYFAVGALIAPALLEPHSTLKSGVFLIIALVTSIILGAGHQPFAAFAGICFTIALVQLLPRVFGRPLEFLGRYSLEIYLVHSIASAAVRVLLLHVGVGSPSIHLAAGLVAGIGAPLVLVYVASERFPFLFVLRTRSRSSSKATFFGP